MPPVAADLDRPGLALNDVFGSKGQVRLLRILSTETEGFRASPEVAARAGLTPSGARKALRRLVGAGLVKKIGTGRATRYTLNEDSVLAGEIVRLFESEREAAEPGWAREHGRREHGRQEHGRRELRPALGRNGGGDGKRTRGNGAAEEARSKGNGNGAGSTIHSLPAEETPHLNLDPANPRIHSALATLLEEELSLLRRARERVLDKLKDRHPGNGHDLWEWRKVLETYPLPRLLHFMESTSPLAMRLRKSSPFVEVISEREKARLGELMERVH